MQVGTSNNNDWNISNQIATNARVNLRTVQDNGDIAE